MLSSSSTPTNVPPTIRMIRRSRWRRIAAIVVLALLTLGIAGYVWFQVSVTPSVLILRAIPGSDALDGGRALAHLVPADVSTVIDERYGTGGEERLAVYFPAETTQPLPTIVWMHGGGFTGGNKEGTRDYLRILASHGYTVVNVEYTKGPEANWPDQIGQLATAIDHVEANAGRFHIDTTQFVLGGDSAGAHMVAQAAAAVTNPDFASQSGMPVVMDAVQLKEVILFSGPYDLAGIDFDNGQWGFYLRTILWAYTGHKDFLENDDTPYFSVTPWITASFPPAFISTGPGDPLLPQSERLASALEQQGVPVTTLLFDPATTDDTIGHEYQMDLGTLEARMAMVEMVGSLRTHVATPLPLAGVSAPWHGRDGPADSPVATPQANVRSVATTSSVMPHLRQRRLRSRAGCSGKIPECSPTCLRAGAACPTHYASS